MPFSGCLRAKRRVLFQIPLRRNLRRKRFQVIDSCNSFPAGTNRTACAIPYARDQHGLPAMPLLTYPPDLLIRAGGACPKGVAARHALSPSANWAICTCRPHLDSRFSCVTVRSFPCSLLTAASGNIVWRHGKILLGIPFFQQILHTTADAVFS